MWFFIKDDFENWHGPHSIHWERLWKSPHIHFLCDSSLYRAVTISSPYRSSTNQSAAVSLFYILMYLNHGSCFLRTLTDRMGFRKLSYIAPNGTWGKKETFLVSTRCFLVRPRKYLMFICSGWSPRHHVHMQYFLVRMRYFLVSIKKYLVLTRNIPFFPMCLQGLRTKLLNCAKKKKKKKYWHITLMQYLWGPSRGSWPPL